jgi:FdhE protein
MADHNPIQPDPSLIGGVPQAPFVRLPDPASVFTARATRFRALAQIGRLSAYCAFLAGIADAQIAALRSLPIPELPNSRRLSRAKEFSMPPLDRVGLKPDAVLRETWERIIDSLTAAEKPPAAAVALARLRVAERGACDAMIANVLTDVIPPEAFAEHVYVAAVLQVHFARLAARLSALTLTSVGIGVCPACGGPPAVSLIVGWQGAETARYACCALCATLWNEVRVKCLICGSTKGIGYQEVADQAGTIKAETCDECGSYVKILYQNKDVRLDPLADDVASLGLDQLLRSGRYRRAGTNPYLIGY